MPAGRFAYDKSGSVLVCADGAEVLVYAGDDERPLWRETLDAPVAGVGTTPLEVVALDARGRLRRFESARGAPLNTVDLGDKGRALAVARDGTAAVLCGEQLVVVAGGQVQARVAAEGAVALAIRDDGSTVAIGGGDGRVRVYDARAGAVIGESRLDGEVKSIAWNVHGFWLVALADRLHRVGERGGDASQLLRTDGRSVGAVACSADGALVAYQDGPRDVKVVVLPSRELVASAIYDQRPVEGLAFGPDVWLGVGLDRGDGNKINLVTAACHRTDTHPGRENNAWTIKLSVEADKVRLARSTANPSAEAVRAKLAEKARLSGKTAATPAPRRPLALPLFLLLGVAAAVVVYLLVR